MAESRILYSGKLGTVGVFRCPPGNPRWQGVNVNGDQPLAAFPWTSVVIHQVGREPVLANSNHVIFYGPGTRYRRALHDARGTGAFTSRAAEPPEIAPNTITIASSRRRRHF